MKRVGVFVGTRPEAIKMALLTKLLKRCPGVECTLVATGQHTHMLDQALGDFDLVPDVYLDVMVGGQTLGALSGRMFLKVDEFFEKNQLDWVLVQGDTTSVLVVAISAFYRGIKIGHVEAGLRSGNIHSPFPEEFNRKTLGIISDIHFAPTEASKTNLVNEGVPESKVVVCGNTVIDSLLYQLDRVSIDDLSVPIGKFVESYPRFVLVTGHRRENFGAGFRGICEALEKLARNYPQVGFLYPVHMNPRVRKPVLEALGEIQNVLLTGPVTYKCFIQLLKLCQFVLTDSGGIQEEAPSLGKPVLIMRENTERPEGIQAGCARLVGTSPQVIYSEAQRLLEDSSAYEAMSVVANPYGDGTASQKILERITEINFVE